MSQGLSAYDPKYDHSKCYWCGNEYCDSAPLLDEEEEVFDEEKKLYLPSVFCSKSKAEKKESRDAKIFQKIKAKQYETLILDDFLVSWGK